eukprot:TRINITY_DN2431_c0_g1_i2.p1 TRINITY_DN2431_c0_g1~~TRINITY_DN2431_c0_g1_i2.p1  ORF type:complete len:207 (+),score=37.95 TRINITY_DN2431_c0_g1_i2:391-1011(+)
MLENLLPGMKKLVNLEIWTENSQLPLFSFPRLKRLKVCYRYDRPKPSVMEFLALNPSVVYVEMVGAGGIEEVTYSNSDWSLQCDKKGDDLNFLESRDSLDTLDPLQLPQGIQTIHVGAGRLRFGLGALIQIPFIPERDGLSVLKSFPNLNKLILHNNSQSSEEELKAFVRDLGLANVQVSVEKGHPYSFTFLRPAGTKHFGPNSGI